MIGCSSIAVTNAGHVCWKKIFSVPLLLNDDVTRSQSWVLPSCPSAQQRLQVGHHRVSLLFVDITWHFLHTCLQEFELRYNARQEGRRYCDPVALEYQATRIPEPIRLKPGSAAPQQMSVYEEFARQVPGFAAASNNVSDLLGQQGNMYNKQNIVSCILLFISSLAWWGN